MVMVVVVALVAWFTVLSPRPKITMTDIALENATPSCGIIFHNPQSVGASFTLVNTGNGNGFAVVDMDGGTTPIGQNTYYVPAGQSVTEVFYVSVDCSSSFAVSVWVSQVKPA